MYEGKDNTIKVICASKKFQRHAKSIRKAGEACLFVGGKKNENVHVYLIKDKEMRGINREFRGKNKATNVLSFREPAGFPRPDMKGEKLLGEIYLAPDFIKKNGEKMAELVVHGILHLLGYTHERLHDRMKMERKEKEILNFLYHDK